MLHVRVHDRTCTCYNIRMRTTIEFDADTAKAIDHLRTTQGRGVSEAVNELIRRGMLSTSELPAFVPRTRALGLTIDVRNVADALDLLDGPEAR
jgi:Ribbon-helix-helix protein, copG family